MSAGDPQIDWLVLTAANKGQARGYRAQLAAREKDGRLRGVKNWMVVADPGDRRVGSGGSTIVVLQELARRMGKERGAAGRGVAALFEGKRVLVIHSGGDSRRLPAYAAEGKVFVPLPCETSDGQAATLFDLVLEDLAGVVRPGRVVVAAGDVFLGIGKMAPDLSAAGMVGVAYPGSADVGSRHGVYVRSADGRVKQFLQKPDLAEARRRGAVDSRGRMLIDTGVLSLDAKTTEAWVGASVGLVKEIEAGRSGVIDLYADVLPGVVRGVVRAERRVGRSGTETTLKASDRCHPLTRALARVPFHVAVVPRCDFLHIGSTRELVRVVSRDARVRRAGMARGATVFNSVVSGRLAAGRDSIVEACRIDRAVRVGRGSVLVGFPGGSALRIDDGCGMVFLPVGRREWACVVFGERDDFKTPWKRGGTIRDENIGAWMERIGIRESDVFGVGDEDRTLWSARVWVIGELDEAVRASRWIAERGGRPAEEWQRAKRVSLAELVPRVNVGRLLAQRAGLQREEAVERAIGELASGRVPPTAAVVRVMVRRVDALRMGAAVRERMEREKRPFARARLCSLAAAINGTFGGAAGAESARELDARAFECIAEGVGRSAGGEVTRRRAGIRIGEMVRASCPVRIDLAGGWSDTPPICQEMGGTVVNAAITLDGERPVEVMARLLEEPEIRLRSEDLGKSVTISRVRDVLSHHDPHDWAALPKAAVVLSGIVPMGTEESLARRLEAFGGGIELTMSVAVPKGSGLGTSSILGATVLACLDRVCGRRTETRSLIERTSVLEQMMSTAGGWQDQAGGLTPGIKILRTRAGVDQVPAVSRVRVPAAAMRELQGRSVLYYTGQRRLARDILHGVVRRYLSGDAGIVRIVSELKSNAESMARELSRGDVDGFARGVLRNWGLKKEIDPGSSNSRIEAILREVVPRLSGYELAGAGGGGFVFMVAKSARDAVRVRRALSRRRGQGRIVEIDVDARGLEVEVWGCGVDGVMKKKA